MPVMVPLEVLACAMGLSACAVLTGRNLRALV